MKTLSLPLPHPQEPLGKRNSDGVEAHRLEVAAPWASRAGAALPSICTLRAGCEQRLQLATAADEEFDDAFGDKADQSRTQGQEEHEGAEAAGF